MPLAILLVLIAASTLIRQAIGVEWSPTSARDLVTGLGWWGPTAFILLVTFRIFLLIPSVILLPAGGVCFGALPGTIYGATGIAVSGMLKFGLARWAGRTAVTRSPVRLPPRFAALGSGGTTAVVVAFATGYPLGPATAAHAGAGLTSISFAAFAGVLVAGSIARAGAFSFFGSSVVDGEGFWTASAVLLVALAAPLLSPRTRAWIRTGGAPADPPGHSTGAAE